MKNKRIIYLLILIIFSFILLVSCQADDTSDGKPAFKALVLPDGSSLITDPEDWEQIKQLDLVYVLLPEGSDTPRPGSQLRYIVEDEIMESYPPQLKAIKIEILSEKSEPMKINLDLAVRIRDHLPMDTVIIDIRSSEDFEQGHVVEASNLPFDQLKDSPPSYYDPEAVLIVYGAEEKQAAEAAKILQDSGFNLALDAGSLDNYSGELEED